MLGARAKLKKKLSKRTMDLINISDTHNKENTMKLITNISGTIINSNKSVDIQLDGKNLIIVGGNGSGKTSLALAIHNALITQIIHQDIEGLTKIRERIKSLEDSLNQTNIDDNERIELQSKLKRFNISLALKFGPIILNYRNPYKAIELHQEKKLALRYFAADRKAAINNVSSATASRPEIQLVDIDSPMGNNLEQHLVNLKVRSALAMQAGGGDARGLHADEWIISLTENLKYLFEDQSTELIFDPDQLRFYISRSDRPNSSFQSLSSGYLAIFEIYANLLMHTEYAQIKPSEFSGVVIIDEIDAHLHVSLQRKILPFFTNSFPAIQFIVTTHSPFVLTSVDDAIIYDITTNQIESDLSMFSFESIIEGLLGVPAISKKLEDSIVKLTEITNTTPFDLVQAERIFQKMTPYVNVLDTESEMFYQIAANKIIKFKAGKV